MISDREMMRRNAEKRPRIEQRLLFCSEVYVKYDDDESKPAVHSSHEVHGVSIVFDPLSLRDWEHHVSSVFNANEAWTICLIDGESGELIASFHACDENERSLGGGFRLE